MRCRRFHVQQHAGGEVLLAKGLTLFLEEFAEWWRAFGGSPFADFGQHLVGDDAEFPVEVRLASTVGARHLFAFLPQAVAWMGLRRL